MILLKIHSVIIKISINNCNNNEITLILEYFYETKKSIIGCSGNSINLVESSDELTSITPLNTDNIPSGNLIKANVILPSGQNKYIIFSHDDKNFQVQQIEIQTELEILLEFSISTTLICDYLYNYEYTECLQSLPGGYYINSSYDKTIDKCHVNCKTCSEGPTENNNKYLSCPDSGKIYFYLGNFLSYEECSNDNF